MSIFPLSIHGLDIKISREKSYQTNIHTTASGKELRSSWRRSPIYNFEVSFNFLRQYNDFAEISELTVFYNSMSGKKTSFVILDTIDNVYRLVRFDEDLELERIVYYIWSAKSIKLVGVVPIGMPQVFLSILSPIDMSEAMIGDLITYVASATSEGYDPENHIYQWVFDDGTTSTGSIVEHSWQTVGVHTTTCTATSTDTSKFATAGRTVNIFPIGTPPVILEITTPTDMAEVIVYEATTYIASATSDGYAPENHTYSWIFDDETTDSGSTVDHWWQTVGIHTTTCTATSIDTGRSATMDRSVLVLEA